VSGSPDRDPVDDLDDLEPLAATLTPLAPPPAARDRLLRALDGPDRFRPFFADLARRFDLSIEAVRRVLSLVDDPPAWLPGPLPGVRLIHFSPGPALAGADAGFVQIPAGALFPRHRHLGPEMAVVLEGSVEDTGRVYHPGEVVEWPANSVHEYRAGAERDLVVIVAHHGIELLQ
jgi:hypothetical protein